MELTTNKSGCWQPDLHKTASTALALFTLPLFCPVTTANEFEELSVHETGGVYSIRGISLIDTPVDYVFNVITDYDHAYRINPAITEVEILPSGCDDVARARNLSEHWIGPSRIKIDRVGDIMEPRDGYLKVDTVSELGSFESGSAIWELRSQGEQTRVLHESSMKPDFFIPPLIGNQIMKMRMERDTLDTFNRIECFAKVTFEVDMENEPELVANALDKGRDCVNTVSRKAHLSADSQ
jgi:hypothetical protein